MHVFSTIEAVNSYILKLKEEGKSVGFVPTMGALHPGHLSLMAQSVQENDISVCSIFVNPIQFNNALDLEKYPRTLEADSRMLEKAGCDIIFAPSVEEMYPDKNLKNYDFGLLDKVLEGKFRPGHFNGVAVVVKKLFDICIPDRAYFGEKDFQQLQVVREMVKQEKMPVDIIACPIIREDDGLAMSSRNVRLSAHERAIAPVIYETLLWIKANYFSMPYDKLMLLAIEKLKAFPEITVEYVEMLDEDTFLPPANHVDLKNLRALIALFLGDVRLIDNLQVSN
jgi:pantoate--beta-alanine ligase